MALEAGFVDGVRTDRSGWSAKERSARLLELLEERERLDVEILQAAGEWDRDKCWAADDALSPVSWLVHRVPMPNTDATGLLRAARHVAQPDAPADAPEAGEPPDEHY